MRKKWLKYRSRSLRPLIVMTAIFAGAVWGAGCDTTAFIAPQNRPLSLVETTGAVSAQACDAETDSSTRMNFTLLDPRRRMVVEGDRVGLDQRRQILNVGENFTTDNLEFRSVRLFPQPDVACTSDDDCTEAGLPSEFTCTSVNPTDGEGASSPRACAYVPDGTGASFSQGTLRMSDSAEGGPRPQVVVYGIVNGRSLHGFAPDADREQNRFQADPSSVRFNNGVVNSIRELYRSNASASNAPAENFVNGSRICFALFEGDEGDAPTYARPTAEDVAAGEGMMVDNCFFEPQLRVSGAQDSTTVEIPTALENRVRNQSRTSQREGNRNVWYSAEQFILEAAGERDRAGLTNTAQLHVVLLTDGPDNGRGDLFDDAADAESVTALAQQEGVALHIVHLDNPGDYAGTGNPPYTGPLDEFNEVACSTGGSYQYTRTPNGMRAAYEALGYAMARSFEVDMEINSLNISAFPRGAYLLAGVFEATFAGDTVTFEYGGDVAPSALGGLVFDRRIPVFRRIGDDIELGTEPPTTISEAGGTGEITEANDTPPAEDDPSTGGTEEDAAGDEASDDDNEESNEDSAPEEG